MCVLPPNKQAGFRTPVTFGTASAYTGCAVKSVFTSLLVVTLAMEAAGTGGGAFFCRMLGERLPSCCCPDDEVSQGEGPVLASSACCDTLVGTAPATSEAVSTPSVADAPERTLSSTDVVPPVVPLDVVPCEASLERRSAARPARRSAIFLSLRQLLI